MAPGDDVRAEIAEIWRRAADARIRAGRAAALAARHEAQATRPPASFGSVHLKIAAVHRQVAVRHLESARLQERYAGRLIRALATPEGGAPPRFIDTVAAVIGVRSAALTLGGNQQAGIALAASDGTARAAHDLEFVLGEGPARAAAEGGGVIRAAGGALCRRWPGYGPAVMDLGVQAVIAAPLQPGTGLGTLCAYDLRPVISQEAVTAVARVADALPLALLAAPGPRAGDGAGTLPLLGAAEYQATINQAAGMVSHRCRCSISDALALLRARAFAAGEPVAHVAGSILRGETRLC